MKRNSPTARDGRKTAQNSEQAVGGKKIKEASTPDGRPRISSEPGVVPSIGKRASKVPSESPTPNQRDRNNINKNPNEKQSNLLLIHNIMTAYMTTSMDSITRTAHTAVDNMHNITVDTAARPHSSRGGEADTGSRRNHRSCPRNRS